MARRRRFFRAPWFPNPNRPQTSKLVGRTVGIGLVLAASNAIAQAPKQEDVPLPPVDVTGQRRGDYRVPQASDPFRLPDLLKDTPQSITVVPQEILKEQAAFTLQDALRNVTGISLAAGEGGVQGDNLTLRGFPARTDLFLDSVRDSGAYFRDTFNLESVEVLKGPSSVMFGRGSTGGAINQVSKTPFGTPAYTLSATGGSGPFYRATVDLNQPFTPSVAGRFNAMFQDAEVVGRNFVEVQRWGVAPSLAFRLGSSTQLTLSYWYQAEDNVPDYGMPYLFGEPADVSRKNWYGLANKDYEETHVHIATARVDHAFTDNIRMRDALRWALYKRDHEVTAPRIVGTPAPGTPEALISVSRGRPSREREDSIITNLTDFSFKFDTWFLKHTLVTGLELGWESADTTTFTVTGMPNANLLHPDAYQSANLTKVRNQTQKTDAFTVGLYAVDEIAITEQWKILGGLRWDRFDADFDNRTTGQEFDRVDSMASPRAAIVFQPTKAQTYYFSYGTSFNPSAEALTLAVNNANTEPEENRSFELGAKWDVIENRLGLRGALFRINKTNARVTDIDSGVLVLEGKQQAQGAEIEIVGRILPTWNVFAGYTFLDTEVLDSTDVNNGNRVEGNDLPNAPRHTLSLWTTWDITPMWQVGGGVTYLSKRFGDAGNANQVPGHVVADATVAFRPVKNFDLRLNVLNLANATYFTQVYQAHVVPGAGRTFLVTATLAF